MKERERKGEQEERGRKKKNMRKKSWKKIVLGELNLGFSA